MGEEACSWDLKDNIRSVILDYRRDPMVAQTKGRDSLVAPARGRDPPVTQAKGRGLLVSQAKGETH